MTTIPVEFAKKLESVIELRLYYYIRANAHDSLWQLTWIEKREITAQYFIKANQIPRALTGLVNAGFLTREKKGIYKLVDLETPNTN